MAKKKLINSVVEKKEVVIVWNEYAKVIKKEETEIEKT